MAECTLGRFNAQQGQTVCADCEIDLLSLICCSFICWAQVLLVPFNRLLKPQVATIALLGNLDRRLACQCVFSAWVGGTPMWLQAQLVLTCKLSTRIVRNYCDVDGWQMVSTSATECIDCAVGRIQPSNGQLHCPLCPPGKYQPNTGTTVCLDCTGTEKISKTLGSGACTA